MFSAKLIENRILHIVNGLTYICVIKIASGFNHIITLTQSLLAVVATCLFL